MALNDKKGEKQETKSGSKRTRRKSNTFDRRHATGSIIIDKTAHREAKRQENKTQRTRCRRVLTFAPRVAYVLNIKRTSPVLEYSVGGNKKGEKLRGLSRRLERERESFEFYKEPDFSAVSTCERT